MFGCKSDLKEKSSEVLDEVKRKTGESVSCCVFVMIKNGTEFKVSAS